ncbi:DNA-binding protein YbaB [Microbacterium sp. 1154]|nr:DNA-binding protein YbaB [Microbacterium sp. 1154]
MARTRDISVEVDAAGVIRDLEIADSALDRGGRRVSAEVMELVAKATKNARVRTLEVTTEIMGKSDPIVGVVAAELIPDQDDDGVTHRGGLR